MPEMADYESALEAIWRDLRQHLEWADGFLLVLLYTLHPAPARELLRRAESLLQTRGLEPLLLRPRDADQAHTIVQTVIAARPEPGGERPAIWLDLWERSGDAEWQAQRYEILARLNERRFLLEQKVGRPLVLILPEEDRGQMHVLAPDLWAVRSYSMGLPVPEAAAEEKGSNLPKLTANMRVAVIEPVEAEWRRLFESVPVAERADRLDPVDGIAATEAALDRGDIEAARTYSAEALVLARARLERAPHDASYQRVLSGVLDAVGSTHRIAGELKAAHTAYTESLSICRQRQSALGPTPLIQHDLSVSLNNLGRVALDLGDMVVASDAFAECLEITRQLHHDLGDTPLALHALAVSLDNAGEVAQAFGDLSVARAAYAESLALRQQLRTILGDSAQVLRDLSVSFENVGFVARAQGDLEAARNAYSESLALSRHLRIVNGDTPGVLEGLARVLGHDAWLQHDLNNHLAANEALQEGADLSLRLVALQPEHPGYRKLLASFNADLAKLNSLVSTEPKT